MIVEQKLKDIQTRAAEIETQMNPEMKKEIKE